MPKSSEINYVVKILVYVIASIFMVQILSVYFGMDKGESVNTNGVKKIDVFFVGSSGILNGISPMTIYKNSGITSYDIGVSWAQIPLEYFLVKKNIYIAKPSVVYLDVESFFDKNPQNNDQLHYAIDKLPLNDKLDLIDDDVYKFSMKDKISFIFPFFRFHDRWKDIQKANLDSNKSAQRCSSKQCYGNYTHTAIMKDTNISYMDNSQDINETTYMKEQEIYILKTNEICKKMGASLVLLVNPTQDWNYKKSEYLASWSESAGLPLLDMNTKMEQTGFNVKTDFYDNHHLNFSGESKISTYMANYLQEHYGLINNRGKPGFEVWDSDLLVYGELETRYINEFNDYLVKKDGKKIY